MGVSESWLIRRLGGLGKAKFGNEDVLFDGGLLENCAEGSTYPNLKNRSNDSKMPATAFDLISSLTASADHERRFCGCGFDNPCEITVFSWCAEPSLRKTPQG